jgi:hypothetical protein
MKTTFWAIGAVFLAGGCSAPGSDGPFSQSEQGASLGTFAFKTLVNTGSCLDARGASTANGTQMDEWTCNSGSGQAFTLQSARAGTVTLVNPSSRKCVDIRGAGTTNGTMIELWTCNGGSNQQFELRDAGGGNVTFYNPSSGRCLDVSFSNTANGTPVQLWDCNGTNAQAWTRTLLGSSGGSSGSSGGGSSSSSSSGSGSSSSSSSGSGSGGSSSSGGSNSDAGSDAGDPLVAARQQCVQIINTDRASLNPPSPPLTERTDMESCVDSQARADFTSNTAHSAFGHCHEFAQDECPGWPGPPSSIDTHCLAAMWAEGPPPAGQDNHWLNMSNAQYTQVACGFYQTPSGDWWATQDFW